MSRHVYGIDFGTNNFKIFDAINEKILIEKNVVAIKNNKNMISYGNEAYEMYEKAPSSINVFFPIVDGVISNMLGMTMVFEEMFNKINLPKIRKKGSFCLAISTNISEVEKRAYYDLIADSKIKAKDIVVIEKPLADAIGMNIDIEDKSGHMIVNIGADTTEISIISMGKIVVSKLIRVGGNSINKNIINSIKLKYNIVVGYKSAEFLKTSLANAIIEESNSSIQVYGMHTVSGLPSSVIIHSDLVVHAILECINSISDNVKTILERTPPDISLAIKENGLHLTGGSSKIPNIEVLLSRNIGIDVILSSNPETSVIDGVSKILNDSSLKYLLYTPRN